MAIDTIETALRENNVLGDPGSGKYKVKKAPLRRVLNQILAATANFGPITYGFAVSTVDGDPGAGLFRLNHATIALATAAYLDNLNLGGADISALIDVWGDSTSEVKGQLLLIKASDPADFHTFSVTGAVVDGTGYRKLTLVHVQGDAAFAADDVIVFQFAPKGDVGAFDFNFAYKADVEAEDIPAAVDRIWMPRAGAELVEIATPGIVKPWHVQSDDGRYFDMRFPDGRVNLMAWAGSDQGQDATDDTSVIQYAFDYIERGYNTVPTSADQGKWQRGQVYIPPGIWRVDPATGVVPFDYIKLIGAGDGQTMIKAHTTGAGSLVNRKYDLTTDGLAFDRVTHSLIKGIRFIATGTSQILCNLHHMGRMRVTECEFTRQDRVDQYNNANQTALASTVGIRLGNSNVTFVGGDIVTIDHCNFYFLAYGIRDAGGGLTNIVGPEATTIRRCEISDCLAPIEINNYGGARGLVTDCVIQRWLAANRAIDSVARRWTFEKIYFESLDNTTRPLLLRSGSENCIVDDASIINYTNTTGVSYTNDGTSSVIR